MLALKLFLPVAAGGLVFGLASGLAILRGAQLPNWLGWTAIVIGIVTATPAGLAGPGRARGHSHVTMYVIRA